MRQFLLGYVGSAIGMLALDLVWLSTMGDRLYRPQLGLILANEFRLGPALAFYALYLFGVTYFAVFQAMNSGGWRKAALNGALLGLVAYGTYDLTNQATLIQWPVLVTVIDLAWGAFLTAFAAVAGYQVARSFNS